MKVSLDILNFEKIYLPKLEMYIVSRLSLAACLGLTYSLE